jgi:WhiB family redox-sensing transcriptional regulator
MSVTSLGWRHRGVCTPADLGVFFGPDGESGAERQAREAKARRVCAPCPVRRECLSFAVTTPQKAGYWGGHRRGRACPDPPQLPPSPEGVRAMTRPTPAEIRSSRRGALRVAALAALGTLVMLAVYFRLRDHAAGVAIGSATFAGVWLEGLAGARRARRRYPR